MRALLSRAGNAQRRWGGVPAAKFDEIRGIGIGPRVGAVRKHGPQAHRPAAKCGWRSGAGTPTDLCDTPWRAERANSVGSLMAYVRSLHRVALRAAFTAALSGLFVLAYIGWLPFDDAAMQDRVLAHIAGFCPPVLGLKPPEMVGIAPRADGRSLRPVLDDRSTGQIDRSAVLIEWAGDDEVPPWRGVRTDAFSYLEHADGTIELYDLVGRLGPADQDHQGEGFKERPHWNRSRPRYFQQYDR